MLDDKITIVTGAEQGLGRASSGRWPDSMRAGTLVVTSAAGWCSGKADDAARRATRRLAAGDARRHAPTKLGRVSVARLN
jgi:NAD(P)-dependent dehydrogenase (short-subunit alcohol dehydrogenase family)